MTDIRGRVIDVRVLRSIPLLDEAVVEAVRQWIYEPLLVNGRPRPVTFTVTVRFELTEVGERGHVPLVRVPFFTFSRPAFLGLLFDRKPAFRLT